MQIFLSIVLATAFLVVAALYWKASEKWSQRQKDLIMRIEQAERDAEQLYEAIIDHCFEDITDADTMKIALAYHKQRLIGLTTHPTRPAIFRKKKEM